MSNHAADNHKLNHTAVNMVGGDLSAAQTDCPRFTQTRNWAENFNQDAQGAAQEVFVTNTIPTSATFTAPGISEPASVIQVSMTGHPNNVITKMYVGASGWKEGLPIATEDCVSTSCSGTNRKRWTWTSWTQDDTNSSFIKNPRVTESKVGDDVSTLKTVYSYTTYGLVSEVQLRDQSDVILKKSVTGYQTASTYTSRRIIGLPLSQEVYGQEAGALNLVSKVAYGYDNDYFTDSSLQQNISPVQHDNTNYGAGLVNGRGNLTSVTRHDVINSSTVTSTSKYNTAGAVVAQNTPGGAVGTTRQVKISYQDSFNDGGNSRNTYAYPTTLTDPAGYSSIVKYRYDIGANVEAKSPDLNSTTAGKEARRAFDSYGRLQKQAIWKNNAEYAYSRYEYQINGVQSKVFATITDGAGEAKSESWMDGAGRVRRSRTEHPGSAGGWSGSLVEYDILGRVKRSTVPTEIAVNESTNVWTPAGDDNRGNDFQGNPIWLWQSQEYDWKSRTTREINTDGTDRLISYTGCGCSGNQITTIQSESVPRDDQPTVNARRTQKIYADAQGRNWKTEVLNWDATSVYSTTKTTFNGRDQATLVRQYAGGDTSSTFQDTTAEYDGFGRIKKTHKPEQQDVNGAATYTTYNYNLDDSIQSIVDARGVSTNYTYNDPRGLLTNISYSGLASPVTPSLTFSYDNVGNRVSMQDGLGTVTYSYNQLSQMTSETRQFNDALNDTTVPADGFKMEYAYTLGGQLKSYKDPYNREFQFGLDKIGRNTSVIGTTAYAEVTSYSSNYQYRAFGSLKQIAYGNQTTATMTYNNRLQPSSYRLNDATQTLFGKDYYYTTAGNNDNDGLLKRSVHIDNTMTANEQAKRNQLNTYDALGRISSSATGEVGLTPFTNLRNGPYQQTYSYDAFNNLTSKNDRDFGLNQVGCSGCPRTINYSETTVKNRTQNSSFNSSDGVYQSITNYQYDNDGRLINRDGNLAQFDATGKMVFNDTPGTDDSYSYDGDGDLLKWVQTGSGAQFYYYVKSSVFGANVLELDSTGAMSKEFVFSSTGSKIAYLKNNEVVWLHEEPSGKESYQIKQDRTASSKTTYDPTGATANGNGYNGGGPCPPQTCYSPENSAMLAQTNRGFDGLERLTQWRNAQWLQSNQFEILRIGIAGFRQTIRPGRNDAPTPPGYVSSQSDDDIIRGEGFGTLDTIGSEFFFWGLAEQKRSADLGCRHQRRCSTK